MSDVHAVTALCVISALAAGSTLALLGNLKLALARRPDKADRQVRILLTVLNALLIPIFLLAGLLVDLLGVRVMLMAGSVILALSFLSLSAGLSYRETLLAAAAASVGAAALLVSTYLLMPAGLFGRDEVSASLQMGLVFLGLGAMLTPALFDLLADTIGFRRTAAVFALLFIVPACLTLPAQGQFPEPPGSTNGALAVLFDPAVLAGCLVFFCYAPLEAFVSVWTTTYLSTPEQMQRQSRWLAGFWLMMILSRLLVAVVQHFSYGFLGDQNPSWLLVVPALLAAVILGNMSGATRTERALPGLLLLGWFLGPLYPMLLGMLMKAESVRSAPGLTFGILHMAGSLGSLALAPLVNLSARARTVQMAMRIPLFIALVLTAMTLLFSVLPR